MFILSDDYHAYEAFRAAKAEYMPCFILGTPGAQEVENVQGPLTGEELRSMEIN